MSGKKLTIESRGELSQHERALIGKLFRRQRVVERIVLDRLPGQEQGQSGVSLWLAQPFGVGGIEHNPVVLRVGPTATIDAEHRRYAEFVDPVVGHERARPLLYATIGQLSGIGYTYLHQRTTNQPLQTLWQYLVGGGDSDAASAAIVHLVHETLAPPARHNGWYNDAQLLDRQRPLWFYNQMLPPTLVLELRAAPALDNQRLCLADVLARADQPSAAQLLGQPIMLHAGGHDLALEIVESSAQRVRLQLLERGAHAGPRSIQPVAARIDLVGDGAMLAQAPSLLGEGRLVGSIQATRATLLWSIYRQQLADLAAQFSTAHGGRLRQGDRALVNPLEHYHRLLTQPRTLSSSIIHGDLNLWNILLGSATPDDERLRAWLIDFEKTGPGGHTVFDAAKLETEYKIHIVSERLPDLDDRIRLERALYQGLIDPDSVEGQIGRHDLLRTAYNFIATLRRAMLCDRTGAPIAPVEYYLSLLGYGLAALKHPKLYDQDQRAQPRAAAAFLSASFAASVIDECAGIFPLEHSYRPLRTLRTRRFLKPELVGRDDLLRQTQRQLRQTPAAVILYGPPGVGRGAVAQALCATLEQQHTQIWTAGSGTQPILDLDTLIVTILQHLPHDQQQLCLEQIFAPRSRQRSDGLAGWIDRACAQLVEILDQAAVPVSLLIYLSHASAQLRSAIGLLTRRVQRTRLIVISDDRFSDDDVDPRAQFEVTPLSVDDVENYVKMQQRALDAQGYRHLHRACLGLPRLLLHFVKEADGQQQQYGSFHAAVMNLRPSRHIDELCQDTLQRLPKPVRRMIELEAVLESYSPTYRGQAGQLFLTIGPSLGWGDPAALAEAAESYRQRAQRASQELEGQQVHDLTPLLLQTALRNVERRPERGALFAALARWCAAQADVEPLSVARYWAAAGRWDAAAAALSWYADDRQAAFTARCAALYAVLGSVLEHTRGDDEEALLELAGDCAAYLGQSHAAAGHYRQLLSTLPEDAPNRARVGAGLLTVLRASADQRQRRNAARALLHRARPGQPLYALCQAALTPSDPAEAAGQLREAISQLEQSRALWGRDRLLFEEQLVSLHEQLAQQECVLQHYDQALEILKAARRTAQRVLSNELLAARLDSVIGIVYYNRGRDDDLAMAQQQLQAAYATRQRMGDRVGQLYTGQNLAILHQNLAQSRADWDAAETFYQRVQELARQVDVAKAWMLVANHMELLIRRGDFALAQARYDEALAAPNRDRQTYLLLLINRAKLALWQRDLQTCRRAVAEVAAQPDLAESPADQLEWIQLCLQAHLLLGLPLDATLPAALDAACVCADDQPLDGAEWLFAAGLLAAAQGDHPRAMTALATSRAIWEPVRFRYHAAHVALWEGALALKHGDRALAQAHLQGAAPLLRSFGDTPAWRWLCELAHQVGAAER